MTDYDKGYDDGYDDALEDDWDPSALHNEEYMRGYRDAWETVNGYP